MRLSESKVVQLIDSEPPTVVITDESNGTEMVLTKQEATLLQTRLSYLVGYLAQGWQPPKKSPEAWEPPPPRPITTANLDGFV
jgi:hypothetical protein